MPFLTSIDWSQYLGVNAIFLRVPDLPFLERFLVFLKVASLVFNLKKINYLAWVPDFILLQNYLNFLKKKLTKFLNTKEKRI